MKLVIDTQIAENYGAHDWNGKGECPQRWKFKSGSTYVVDGITPAQKAQKARIESEGTPTLAKLIEENNDSYREYIISARVVEDDAPEGEPWETPFRLSYHKGRWIASRTIDNTSEFGGQFRREIQTKVETYVLGEGGERLEYKATYVLTNGRTAAGPEELQFELKMMEDA